MCLCVMTLNCCGDGVFKCFVNLLLFFPLAGLCQRRKTTNAEVFASFVKTHTGRETFFICMLYMFYLNCHESEPQLYFVGLELR